jgi:DNA-directed RNA polymerase subunit M/transcription elongation factor TFIIS
LDAEVIKILKEPESMDELVYYTNRDLDKGGEVVCWVRKQKCPKCGKALMGKPLDPKTGRPKIRAKEYVCPECGHTEEKDAYEETLTAEAKYTCPGCKKKGESTASFRRKKIDGVETLRLKCQHCAGNIDVTKKMANKKGEAAEESEE